MSEGQAAVNVDEMVEQIRELREELAQERARADRYGDLLSDERRRADDLENRLFSRPLHAEEVALAKDRAESEVAA